MEQLEFTGALVASDPMGTQIKIADIIVRRGGGYLLAPEENWPVLHANVETFCVNPAAQGCETVEITDADQLRIEVRRYVVCHDIRGMLSDGRYVGGRASRTPRSLSRSLKTLADDSDSS